VNHEFVPMPPPRQVRRDAFFREHVHCVRRSEPVLAALADAIEQWLKAQCLHCNEPLGEWGYCDACEDDQ
jgi:hypothetical protein